MSNPLNDLAAFLTADTGDYQALGAARYVILVVFYALVIASLTLLVVNLRDERMQRSGRLLWWWFARVVIGCLWFQAMLSTLPFGPGNALHGWIEQMAARTALPRLARFAGDVLLPHYGLVDPLLFLVAFGLATAFILGAFVRLAGIVSLLMGLTVWLGLYGQPSGDAAIGSWTAVLLALVSGSLAVVAAGRALGADAWIRRNVAAVRDRRPAGLLLRILT